MASKQVTEIADWLRIFIALNQVTELRAIDVQSGNGWSHTEAGFFDYASLEKMAVTALDLTRTSTGVYFIPNPILPETLARCSNKTKKAKTGESVSDSLIVERKWFLVDADPKRIEGVSSTDGEKDHALDCILKARELLIESGINWKVLADSGNGYHLICPCIGATTDGQRIKMILNCLASKLNNKHVEIDRKVFNPARIVKLYGTWSRKGDNTTERPHRRSCILEVCDK